MSVCSPLSHSAMAHGSWAKLRTRCGQGVPYELLAQPWLQHREFHLPECHTYFKNWKAKSVMRQLRSLYLEDAEDESQGLQKEGCRARGQQVQNVFERDEKSRSGDDSRGWEKLWKGGPEPPVVTDSGMVRGEPCAAQAAGRPTVCRQLTREGLGRESLGQPEPPGPMRGKVCQCLWSLPWVS